MRLAFILAVHKHLFSQKMQNNCQQHLLIIYVSGAIGFEAVSGKVVSIYEEENLWFKLIYTAEELFEMVGIAIFIFGLLVHLQQQTGSITFMLKEQK